MGIMSFFEMFDKLDDVVYAPISAICDGFRQPLKQLDASTERKKMELDHKLEMEMRQIGVDLEVDRMKRIKEIEQWEKDQERERKVAYEKDAVAIAEEKERIIEQYRRNMATVAVEIGEAIGEMSINLQAIAQDMIVEKTKKFKDLEIEALNEARQGVKEIQMMFPDDEAIRMEMIKPYQAMMMNVVSNTNAFVLDMKESMKKLSENINVITDRVMANTDKYLEPLCGGQLNGIKKQENKELENNTMGYIEG